LRVVGVIDLLGGRAVHARAGRRDTYQPVDAVVAATPIHLGDALGLARAYVDRLGIDQLYAADLDALAGRRAQSALVAEIVALGAPLLLDAGVTSVAAARRARTIGADRVVVALETLDDYDSLRSICAAIGGRRVAFSLDLRDGEPVTAAANRLRSHEAPDVVAARARDAGADTVIVIDLARVGTGSGVDLDLLGRVRKAATGMTLLAGGGVRGVDDLMRLGDAGCDGALVATALLDGRIGAGEIAAARSHRSSSR
jgi:HisA/HisF family protein